MTTRQDYDPAGEVQTGQEVPGLEGRRKVKTGMKLQGLLSPEAWLMAVDPQDSQEGPQLNLKSGSSGGH